jgi:Mg2+ and Co2+ transporter CorA
MDELLLQRVQANMRVQVRASEEIFEVIEQINKKIRSTSAEEIREDDMLQFLKYIRKKLVKTGENLSDSAVMTSRFVLERI